LAGTPLYIVINAIWARGGRRATLRASSTNLESEAMKQYVIERNIPGVGELNREQLKGAAGQSNAALAKLAGRVQWVQSFVAADKTFCIYLADSEQSVHEHAKLSGFPASKVTEVRGVISPMTAAGG